MNTTSPQQDDQNERIAGLKNEQFTFTLTYRLSEADSNQDAIVERLGEAGSDDALIGIGQPGRLALEFTREAASAELAMVSALADIKRAVPSAQLIEAAPDFVGLTDQTTAAVLTLASIDLRLPLENVVKGLEHVQA